ncbi:outer membrane lipoprotein carrier protein LolA [candidate division WOR-3 bacterium]|nr:outer membrane lipoprotein carrier protein LolA [candidate division WOR-3 bacterium]
MMIFLFISSSLLSQVTEHFNNIQSLECSFVETLKFEAGTFDFSGSVFISRDAAKIEVERPDKQIIISRGDSVFIYIKKDNRLECALSPISLSRLIFCPVDYYYVDSIEGEWVHLSPRDPTFSYPIFVKFDKEYFPKEIRFTQEGGEGRFRFSKFKLNPLLPEEFFSIDSFR